MTNQEIESQNLLRKVPFIFQPDWPHKARVDFFRTAFTLLFILLCTRFFLIQPFRIPSGSMIPTLMVGDFILVKRFSYGLINPISGKAILIWRKPKRGDVIVFLKPNERSIYYIKRVIGLPGDRIRIKGRELYINGELVNLNLGTGTIDPRNPGYRILSETLPGTGVVHPVRLREGSAGVESTYEVPAGKYFVLGDNRDESLDSRFWGFVPQENIQGLASFVWLSLQNVESLGEMRLRWDRIGQVIH